MNDFAKMMLTAMMMGKINNEHDEPLDVCNIKISMNNNSLATTAEYSKTLITLLGSEGEEWMEETNRMINPVMALQSNKLCDILEKKDFISCVTDGIKID